MKESDIIRIWKNHTKSDPGEVINHENLKRDKLRSAKSVLTWHIVRRALEAIIFLVFISWLMDFVISNYPFPQFVVAGLVLVLFCLIGLAGNVREIIIILLLDPSGPVLSFQHQMERLKMHNLNILRIMLLSTPFYWVYLIIGFKVWLGQDILSTFDSDWLVAQVYFSVFMLFGVIWLYRQLNYTSNVRWVRKLILDNGGRQLSSAFRFLDEIAQYKKETNESDNTA